VQPSVPGSLPSESNALRAPALAQHVYNPHTLVPTVTCSEYYPCYS
jgi:hypothetical protein